MSDATHPVACFAWSAIASNDIWRVVSHSPSFVGLIGFWSHEIGRSINIRCLSEVAKISVDGENMGFTRHLDN